LGRGEGGCSRKGPYRKKSKLVRSALKREKPGKNSLHTERKEESPFRSEKNDSRWAFKEGKGPAL